MFNSRRAAGWRSKRLGQNFEAVFEFRSLRAGLEVVRIPDGCRPKGRLPNGKPILMQVKSPFDWILKFGPSYAFIDTKSFDSDNLIYSAIDENQLKKLLQLERPARSGYVVYLRPVNEIRFFSASSMARLLPRQSLSKEEGLLLGNFDSLNPRLLFSD